MRDRCLRTVLMSPIPAPDLSSARFTACFSASVSPATGAIQLAEAPPDISTSTRSSADRTGGEGERAFRSGKARRIRDGMAGFHDLDDPGRTAIAAPRDRHARDPRRWEAVEVMRLRDLGHGARGLSGGQDDEPARRRRVRQMRHETACRMGGCDCGSIEFRQEGARSVHEFPHEVVRPALSEPAGDCGKWVLSGLCRQ